MRRLALTGAILAMVACTSSGEPTTTTMEPLPPPPSPTTAADTPSTPATPDGESSIQTIEGFLPDGTDYTVYLETPAAESLEAISGDIVYEVDGQVWWAADVGFVPEEGLDGIEKMGNLYRIPAGRFWTAEITFVDELLEMLGDDAETVILESLAGFDRRNSSTRPFPVLDLTSPFRWSTAQDPTGPMEVRYSTILVEPGCDEYALACVANETLQVIPRSGYRAAGATIESFYPRPISDPFYLDPGPLFSRSTPRTNADVLWTGNEMIVWADGEGAAYRPEADRWRTLPQVPGLAGGTPSRAVWAGDQMIVFSTEGTFSYGPDSDTWSSVSFDIAPPNLPFAVTSTHIYFISNGAPFVFNRDSYQYDSILAPPSGFGAQSWETYPFVFEDTLMLARIEGDRCSGRTFWRLEGIDWAPLPETSLATEQDRDCSTANQVAVAGDQLLIWDDPENLTKMYREGEWIEVERIPGGGGESPSSALVAGSRVLVPDWTNVAMFDMASLTWEVATYPGSIATGTEWIWTGSEVLAWVDGADAWRWTPPE